MTRNIFRKLQVFATALLVVLAAAGCSSTTSSGVTERPAGTITVREGQLLRIGAGGSGEGTLVFRGWQHTFLVENMVLSAIGPGSVELDGEVWNLENVEDFAGTYRPVKQDYDGEKGLSGVWMENEKGVRVQVRTVGQDLSVRVDSTGSIVTLK
ncbi:hypothetical protein [Marinobacter alexandrii]|uniref:hypothetical protein n=1 Tax=Marinobacter alexandrii TaxID=2570351 RepID=UPI003299674D